MAANLFCNHAVFIYFVGFFLFFEGIDTVLPDFCRGAPQSSTKIRQKKAPNPVERVS
jgi:hypothetical protein